MKVGSNSVGSNYDVDSLTKNIGSEINKLQKGIDTKIAKFGGSPDDAKLQLEIQRDQDKLNRLFSFLSQMIKSVGEAMDAIIRNIR